MVEFDELEKRLAWLDSERQKDKKLIKDLQDTIERISRTLLKQKTEIKSLETAVKVNSTSSSSNRSDRRRNLNKSG